MSSSPMKSGSPSKGEMDTLRSERDRIKAQLYAEYGERINTMMADEVAATSRITPSERREKRLQELLSERTPLRQEVKTAQTEALQRLIDEAKRDSDKGVDVGSRLSMLLSMQESSNRPKPQPEAAKGDAVPPAAPTTAAEVEAPAAETEAAKEAAAPSAEEGATAVAAGETTLASA